ncbi:GNAT family N-acetyltransferase [Agrobacterium vitis]|uniref:GNAT family N-acetyltransferase n=1 Tax=Agrobacterium vitis TaxID=373 RepID=A0A368NK58_AGRVI|nr:GNAT family N-acetyltransferase [Agrobacterium vitis]KAA3511831.1 GNAT family N-acetyltransferase [Agrobacterium vitis]KAA3525276.1 GNAT family N-acetyltransferase [Agrobacterium vitis]MCF1479265.1 GNAT family N-acetyltransferase [Agrobacterium vitis]MUZ97646.1 GNAT family N-acetyltransferase [Agrobacterium vitis]MVA30375.1 GNAT family N-acetyltransferase [Agrobacterium vitis]
MPDLKLETFDEVPQGAEALIDSALTEYHDEMLGGPANLRKLFIPLHDQDGAVEGGIVGQTGRKWLFIAMLFVPEYRRGQGIAGNLLAAAEREARKRGCKAVYLDTINPVARRTYQKHGYSVVGGLDEFTDGYSVTWMKKQL